MTEERRRRPDTEQWNFKRVGSYGSFTTAGSLPIDFLLTTFQPAELWHLTFARDVSPGKLNFQLLMQRDLDESRARTKLAEYLNPKGPNPTQFRAESVFFPPLLVACVPTERGKILAHYPDESWQRAPEGRPESLVREWAELVKLDFFLNDGSPSKTRSIALQESADIDDSNVLAHFKLSRESEKGAKLVAIDGQHRLFALQQLARRHEAVAYLTIPVCILFSTSTSVGTAERLSGEGIRDIPTVPEIFRKVFVDVNQKIEPVGAHFTILLNDNEIGSLIVRQFCDHVIKQSPYEERALTAVEWNVRSVKDSTVLTRDYSITSIGILEKSLKECFGKRPTYIPRLLDLEDAQVSQALKDAADEGEDETIKWDRFSIAQRKILEKQADKSIVAALYHIFFESRPYKEALARHIESLNDIEQKANDNRADAADYQAALDALKNFKPIVNKESAYKIIQEMGVAQRRWRAEQLSPVLHYALFQRSLFLTMFEIMKALPGIPVVLTGQLVARLLENAVEKQIFSYSKRYTVYTIWQGADSIVNRQSTRKQFSRLSLALLGNSQLAADLVRELELANIDERAKDKLITLGVEQAGDYWGDFVDDRETHLMRSYRTNLSLDEEQLEQLQAAEEAQGREIEKIQRGEISEDEAEHPFRAAVREYLRDELRTAEQEMRATLGFDKHIVDLDPVSDDENSDDS